MRRHGEMTVQNTPRSRAVSAVVVDDESIGTSYSFTLCTCYLQPSQMINVLRSSNIAGLHSTADESSATQ